MDRKWKSGAAVGAPALDNASDGYATAGNPGTGVPATKPGPHWYHMVTEELLSVIAAAGIAFDKLVVTQLRDAIQALIVSGQAPILGQAKNLVVKNNVTTPNSKIDLTADEVVLKNAGLAPYLATGVVAVADITLNGVSGLDNGAEGASTWYYAWLIKKTTPFLNTAVVADAGTDRITLNAHGMAANSPVKFGGGGAPAGLVLGTVYYIRDVTANDFKVAATPAGAAIDLTTAGAAVTLTETPAVIISASSSAPVLPAGYTFKALLSAIRNDGSSNFLAFSQLDNKCELVEQLIFTGATSSTAYTSQSLSVAVPPTAKVAHGIVGATSSVDRNVRVASTSAGHGAATAGINTAAALDSFSSAQSFRVAMLEAQTAYWKSEAVDSFYRMTITGFEL